MGFLLVDAEGATTLDGNTNNINWDLGDVSTTSPAFLRCGQGLNSIVGAFKPESTTVVLMAGKVGRAGVPEIGLVSVV